MRQINLTILQKYWHLLNISYYNLINPIFYDKNITLISELLIKNETFNTSNDYSKFFVN